MTTERYAEQFLLCLLEVSGGSLTEFLDPEAIMESARLDMPEKVAVFSLLIEQGYVSSGGETRDRPVYALRFTNAGLEHAQHLRRISRSKAERDVYLHNWLVRWAYDNTSAGGSASLQEFAGDEHWWFAGTEVTWDEVFAAVDFLEAENLLAVERIPGYIGVRPTPLGIKFALSHMTLRTFMSTQQPHSSSVTNHFGSIVVQGNATGNNLATGGGNTQTVNQGVDGDALASLVAQLRQIAPTLELSQEDAEELAEEIDTLESEGAEPTRGRRIMRRIARIVTPALPAAAAAGADAAVQAAIAVGTGLFG